MDARQQSDQMDDADIFELTDLVDESEQGNDPEGDDLMAVTGVPVDDELAAVTGVSLDSLDDGLDFEKELDDLFSETGDHSRAMAAVPGGVGSLPDAESFELGDPDLELGDDELLGGGVHASGGQQAAADLDAALEDFDDFDVLDDDLDDLEATTLVRETIGGGMGLPPAAPRAQEFEGEADFDLKDLDDDEFTLDLTAGSSNDGNDDDAFSLDEDQDIAGLDDLVGEAEASDLDGAGPDDGMASMSMSFADDDDLGLDDFDMDDLDVAIQEAASGAAPAPVPAATHADPLAGSLDAAGLDELIEDLDFPMSDQDSPLSSMPPLSAADPVQQTPEDLADFDDDVLELSSDEVLGDGLDIVEDEQTEIAQLDDFATPSDHDRLASTGEFDELDELVDLAEQGPPMDAQLSGIAADLETLLEDTRQAPQPGNAPPQAEALVDASVQDTAPEAVLDALVSQTSDDVMAMTGVDGLDNLMDLDFDDALGDIDALGDDDMVPLAGEELEPLDGAGLSDLHAEDVLDELESDAASLETDLGAVAAEDAAVPVPPAPGEPAPQPAAQGGPDPLDAALDAIPFPDDFAQSAQAGRPGAAQAEAPQSTAGVGESSPAMDVDTGEEVFDLEEAEADFGDGVLALGEETLQLGEEDLDFGESQHLLGAEQMSLPPQVQAEDSSLEETMLRETALDDISLEELAAAAIGGGELEMAASPEAEQAMQDALAFDEVDAPTEGDMAETLQLSDAPGGYLSPESAPEVLQEQPVPQAEDMLAEGPELHPEADSVASLEPAPLPEAIPADASAAEVAAAVLDTPDEEADSPADLPLDPSIGSPVESQGERPGEGLGETLGEIQGESADIATLGDLAGVSRALQDEVPETVPGEFPGETASEVAGDLTESQHAEATDALASGAPHAEEPDGMQKALADISQETAEGMAPEARPEAQAGVVPAAMAMAAGVGAAIVASGAEAQDAQESAPPLGSRITALEQKLDATSTELANLQAAVASRMEGLLGQISESHAVSPAVQEAITSQVSQALQQALAPGGSVQDAANTAMQEISLPLKHALEEASTRITDLDARLTERLGSQLDDQLSERLDSRLEARLGEALGEKLSERISQHVEEHTANAQEQALANQAAQRDEYATQLARAIDELGGSLRSELEALATQSGEAREQLSTALLQTLEENAATVLARIESLERAVSEAAAKDENEDEHAALDSVKAHLAQLDETIAAMQAAISGVEEDKEPSAALEEAQARIASLESRLQEQMDGKVEALEQTLIETLAPAALAEEVSALASRFSTLQEEMSQAPASDQLDAIRERLDALETTPEQEDTKQQLLQLEEQLNALTTSIGSVQEAMQEDLRHAASEAEDNAFTRMEGRFATLSQFVDGMERTLSQGLAGQDAKAQELKDQLPGMVAQSVATHLGSQLEDVNASVEQLRQDLEALREQQPDPAQVPEAVSEAIAAAVAASREQALSVIEDAQQANEQALQDLKMTLEHSLNTTQDAAVLAQSEAVQQELEALRAEFRDELQKERAIAASQLESKSAGVQRAFDEELQQLKADLDRMAQGREPLLEELARLSGAIQAQRQAASTHRDELAASLVQVRNMVNATSQETTSLAQELVRLSTSLVEQVDERLEERGASIRNLEEEIASLKDILEGQQRSGESLTQSLDSLYDMVEARSRDQHDLRDQLVAQANLVDAIDQQQERLQEGLTKLGQSDHDRLFEQSQRIEIVHKKADSLEAALRQFASSAPQAFEQRLQDALSDSGPFAKRLEAKFAAVRETARAEQQQVSEQVSTLASGHKDLESRLERRLEALAGEESPLMRAMLGTMENQLGALEARLAQQANDAAAKAEAQAQASAQAMVEAGMGQFMEDFSKKLDSMLEGRFIDAEALADFRKELVGELETLVPQAAARIIREEILALAEEDEEDYDEAFDDDEGV